MAGNSWRGEEEFMVVVVAGVNWRLSSPAASRKIHSRRNPVIQLLKAEISMFAWRRRSQSWSATSFRIFDFKTG